MGSGASSTKPTLYSFPSSAPCRAVLMTARIANIALDVKTLDLMKGEQNGASFLEINPDHTVPTIVDGPLRLWESRAIMQYLVDQYAPNHNLYPRDPVKRAQVDRMLQYDLSNVYRRVSEYIYPQLFAAAPADPEKALAVEKVLDYLENILKNQAYVAAAHVTLADLSITAMLSMLELKNWKFDRWPKVSKWRKSMRDQPWYAEPNKGLEDFKKHLAA